MTRTLSSAVAMTMWRRCPAGERWPDQSTATVRTVVVKLPCALLVNAG
ncbi:MAG TPA: hypothetical protein VLZ77_12845 [Acidimicrobiales bacterium]|nr:hypothetical protein [Acidimicrobiales bacterium]